MPCVIEIPCCFLLCSEISDLPNIAYYFNMFNVKQSPGPEIDACFQPELLKGFEDNSFGIDI